MVWEWIRPVSISLAALCLWPAACAQPDDANQTGAPAATQRLVVLSISQGPDPDYREPIQGTIPCESAMDVLCFQDPVRLAQAVLSCGSSVVTMDHRASHVKSVYFPSDLHAQFPMAIPTDLEIVRCVQGQVGFGFSAGIATDPDDLLSADEAPFRSLHRPARGARQ